MLVLLALSLTGATAPDTLPAPGTSPSLDWTLIIVGALGMVGTFTTAAASLLAAVVSARRSREAVQSSRQAEANSRPVSNGFAPAVLATLGRMELRLSEHSTVLASLGARAQSNSDRITVLEGARIAPAPVGDLSPDDRVLTVVDHETADQPPG